MFLRPAEASARARARAYAHTASGALVDDAAFQQSMR